MHPILAVVPAIVFVTVNVALLFYGWRFRSRPGGRAFLVFVLAGAGWAVGQILIGSGPTMPFKIAGLLLKATTGAVIPAASLVFVLVHTGRARWVSSRLVLALALFPVVSLGLIAWNPGDVAFVDVRFETVDGLPQLLFRRGPAYYLLLLYAYGLLAVSTILVLTAAVRSPALYRRQALPLLIATLVPLAGNLLFVLGITSAPTVDPTAPAVTIAALALLWALLHDELLDLAPIARAAVFSSMSDGVIVLDGARRIVDLNPAAEQILGKPPAAVLGQAASNVLGVSLETGLGEGRRITRQDLAIGTGASQRDYELRYSPLHGARNDPVGWLIVLRDVTDRKALEQQLRYQAFHDSLTGLVNRRMFLDRLDQALGGERPVQVAVLFIDLDGFKEINDRFGHAAGDELLKAVAKRLAGCTRAEDLIVRYGGDEFAVLIAPVGDEADIRRVADRALAAIGEPFAIGGRTVQIGGSAGYAFADAGSRADDLLHRADVALYAAKAAGKGRAAAYQPRLEVEPAFLTD